MPPAAGRPHSADLLVCGHHDWVSREALAASALVLSLPGRADVAEAALLEDDHHQHAEVIGL